MRKLNKQFYDDTTDQPLYVIHSARNLKQRLKNERRDNLKTTDLKKFLSTQRAYTLYRSSPKIKQRNFYHVYGINNIWQIDLLSVIDLSKTNNEFKYLLTCIDIFSKMAYVQPIKSKSANDVVKAFAVILQRANAVPEILRHDKGKEFLNWKFREFAKSKGIKQQFCLTTLPTKCAVIESFNRTIRLYLMRLFAMQKMKHKNNTKRYIDELQNLVNSYNNTIHSSTKYAPIMVNKENATQVYHNMYYHRKKIRAKHYPRIQVDDFVRVIRKKNIFDKMQTNWSEEVFKVKRVIPKQPYTMYEIVDLHERPVQGYLYEQEIQKINLPFNTPVKLLSSDNNANVSFETNDGQRKKLNMHEYKANNAQKEENDWDVIKSLTKKL